MTASRAGLGSSGENRLALRVTAATVGVVTLTLATAWVAGRPLAGATALHATVLLVVLAVGRVGHRLRSAEARGLLTASAVIGAMFFLYTSLGQVAFVAIPWDGDVWVRAVDRVLGLGVEPAAWVGSVVSARAWAIEPLAFFYGAFIPYLYLSIFLGLIGRPAHTRAVFVLAFALLYGASFMGYLFVPARGPVVSMSGVFAAPLDGGAFHALILRSIELAGGPHGAFPSLHVGASCLAAIVDFRHGDKLRALIYVPLVLAICVATVALRYHYVVDIAAGAALAYAAVRLAEAWVRRATLGPESS